MPLAEIEPNPVIAALPKADLHIHQEWSPRLDRVLARREGRTSYNWCHLAERLMAETPPGMQRLRYLASIFPVARDVDAEPENLWGQPMKRHLFLLRQLVPI
ncbi:hypothetical protein [Nostoc sp. LEGE 12450]|uniref:hypothetical protein n=1 Tax=Nostoc sp. LEGE 12450 TaxID=1828643 RepID=UPI001880B2A9|nr:hypothetical protein [Nostoc sp. LEGE 12450]MBE8991159.1 hypothetical protein [Nostoc sp. LEGE 12450]